MLENAEVCLDSNRWLFDHGKLSFFEESIGQEEAREATPHMPLLWISCDSWKTVTFSNFSIKMKGKRAYLLWYDEVVARPQRIVCHDQAEVR